MSHAKLSPSAAERWMTCAGSVVLSDGMPEKSSAFAEEGTKAHGHAETILRGGVISSDDIDDEMLGHVLVYTDYVESLLVDDDDLLFIEQRVKVSDEVYGTADAVVWQPAAKHLHITDLKYGAGVAVEVHGNLQLKIYALASLLTFGYPASQVTATIVQPRCPHSDGPIRSATFDVVDLLDFHADLLDAVERVKNAQALAMSDWPYDALQPSEKGCRWCLAAPKCPALKQKAQELAKRAFVKGDAYDPAELAETLDYLPILEGWIKNVREFAYEEAERGKAIPNWKLVEKRATRKWRDEDAARAALEEAFPDADGDVFFTEPELKSPAAIEKLLPKEQRALLDELCVKESSGHTLVHESDKRPAIQVDAKSAFANS